ncbi:DNA internalization-related competence protein ComEC/Rec2 [Herminiimonas sp. CN]|uniref:DNA internalization-related competence protein ComEC/Rec2 n=1 Tax=Herminiimonas sp. CN TaxID=1349818 RepID=UPI0004743F31|nr:DNA internalization-related competence protein ComEC/Rec2 [Herminiimonas sp. CN]
MRSAIIGFVIGIVWLQNQPLLPSLAQALLLLAAAALLGMAARRWPQPVLRATLLLACGAALGFVWAGLLAQQRLAHALPDDWEGRDVTLIGTVDSLPYRFEQGVRFNLALEQVLPPDGSALAVSDLPPKIALSWYAAPGAGGLPAAGGAPAVEPGERWQFRVRLQKPHGNANPGGFDYEVWLLEQNLRATGYVRTDAQAMLQNRRLSGFVFGIGNLVERCRARLRERIQAALPDHAYAGVIVALVVGDQRGIDQSDWKVFNRSGIGHLISISGLHITMVAGLFAAFAQWLWRRSLFTGAELPLLLPAQKVAALSGVVIALLYVLLAGFGVPAQRTLYMLTVVAVALWFGRLTSVSHVLCAALLAVAVLDPWAVLWPGYWLSFGAVAIILYASVGRAESPRHSIEASGRQTRWRQTLTSAARTQYVVTLGLVPLTMLLFGQVSLVSPLANAVAIPLVSLLVTPLALAGSVLPAPLSGWILTLAHALVTWLADGLQWLASWPGAVWSAPLPSWWVFLFALLGTLWLLAPRGWPLRWLGLAGWLPLLLNSPTLPQPGRMWVTAFDVGQGTALLIETPQHRLLYDTGPYYSPQSNGGNRVILPYLKTRGIAALDALVVSHNDSDHSGGALSILDEIKVGQVWSSLALTSAIVAASPRHQHCTAGQSWQWDGVRFEMLHPQAASFDNPGLKPNALSCTLKISIGSLSILLPGDIEASQESELLGSNRAGLHATVLLAPHHGSGTSSSIAFLDAVRPDLALFQVGYRNRYRHPKPEVFERYRAMGIPRLRNDASGAITLQFDQALHISEYRSSHARYWHGR